MSAALWAWGQLLAICLPLIVLGSAIGRARERRRLHRERMARIVAEHAALLALFSACLEEPEPEPRRCRCGRH